MDTKAAIRRVRAILEVVEAEECEKYKAHDPYSYEGQLLNELHAGGMRALDLFDDLPETPERPETIPPGWSCDDQGICTGTGEHDYRVLVYRVSAGWRVYAPRIALDWTEPDAAAAFAAAAKTLGPMRAAAAPPDDKEGA